MVQINDLTSDRSKNFATATNIMAKAAKFA